MAFIYLNLSAQVLAVFSADVTQGCDELTVQFTDESTPAGEIVTWVWDLGDGNTSSIQNPEHIYNVPGAYEICLTVTNNLGEMNTHCETDFITIVETPVADAGSDIVLDCLNSSATLIGSGSSSGPNIAYTWLDPNGDIIGVDPTVNVFIPGTYTLIVTDLGICTSTDMVDVVSDILPPIVIINAGSPCISPYTLTSTGSSSGPEFSYEWTDENSTSIGTDTELVITDLGFYTLIITNVVNGCYSLDEIEVTNLDVNTLALDGVVQNISCAFGNDGAIDLTVIGGQPPYTFIWSDATASATEDIDNIEAGTYSVTVTDASDCSTTDFFIVDESSQVIVNSSVANVLCFGEANGVIDLFVNGGTAPYTYDWADLPGTSDPQNRINITAGVYNVIVTDSNNCSSEYFYTVDEPALLILDFNVQCSTETENGSIDMTVTGGTPPYLYEWSTGFQIEDLNDLATGIYSITVTDTNGCTVEGEVELGTTIEQLIGGDTTYCDNSQAQLEVVAPNAVTYEWSTGNLSCYDCPNPIATVGLGEETFYSVTVTEADGCIDIGYLDFNVQSYLDFNLLEFSNSPVYAGQDIVFNCNVPNASSVSWTGPNGFQSSDCNAVIPNANSGLEGQYTLDIIDQYGCAANASTDVVVYDIIEFISNDTMICQGDSVQLEVIAPNAVSVSWSPSISLDDPNSTTPFAMPNFTAIYTVTVEDINGFSESASVQIEVTEFPVLVDLGPITVCEGESVLLCADPFNLPGAYLWTWPSGTTTESCFDVIPLPGECFTLNYTAPDGCAFEDEICLDVIPEILITDSYSDTICRDGAIELSLDLPNPSGISYEWAPADFLDCTNCENPIASVLETTVFSVTVTEVNGCTDEATFEVVVDQGCVWPGDTDSSYVVNNLDLLNIGLAFDSVGPVRSNASLNWIGQSADNWSQSTPDGVNYKFIDCDGNGIINSDDTLGITQNWGDMHNFTGDDDTQLFGPNYPQSGVTVTVPFYVEPDTLIENESYALPIILGESGNEAENVYGLAFTLEYDSTVIVPGSASIGVDGWLGTLNNDMISIQKTFISPGVIDVGITRIDGTAMNGFGQLGILYITIEDDVLLRLENDNRDDDAVEINFNITNVLMINNLGEEIPVVPMETSMILEETVATSDINWDEYIQVAPNPVDDILYLTTKNIEIETLKLFLISGELLMESTARNLTNEINTSHLNPGMYLLEVSTDLGVMVKRVVVMR